MLFDSFLFLFIFLPVVLFVALRLKGETLLAWIVLSSFVFYGAQGHAWFLIPMLFTMTLDFFLAQLLNRTLSSGLRKGILWLSLCCNLGLLIYFKYAGTFLIWSEALFQRLGKPASPVWINALSVALPAGISFYTFQTISYMVDVYRGRAQPERNFWKFAGFVSFFPHLVAGPLTRHDQLIPGLDRLANEGVQSRWEEGIFLFAVGLCKKLLLADRIAACIDPMIGTISTQGGTVCWLLLFGYGFQIYFDFSGYSDMAIGLGRLFGIELPQNFDSPYKAKSPADFWRRWHMTLSFWLRDYLFYPLYLGMSRDLDHRFKLAAALLITMFLGGLWHGASWMFGLWGLYHGLLLLSYGIFQKKWDQWNGLVQRGITFIAISISWLFFRSSTLSMAGQWARGCLGFRGFQLGPFVIANAKFLALFAVGAGIIGLFPNAGGFKGFARFPWAFQVGLGGLVVLGLLFMNYSSNFIYFRF